MRDITELDGLANEVKVCVSKADNYVATAKQKIAPVAPALDAGEFPGWDAARWLLEKCELTATQLPVYLPTPSERAAAVIAEFPDLSDRAVAAMAGVGNKTASRVRATVSRDTVGTRTGLDGKERRMPKRATPAAEQVLDEFVPSPPKSTDAPPWDDAVVQVRTLEDLKAYVSSLSLTDFAAFKEWFRAYCGA